MSIHEANSKFQTIDNSILELKKEAAAKGDYHPYDKTRFEINCIYDGQEFTYAGKQTLGSGDGSLVTPIVDMEAAKERSESQKNRQRRKSKDYKLMLT